MSQISKKDQCSDSKTDPLMPRNNNEEDDGWSSFRTHSSFFQSDSSDRDWLENYR